MLLTLRPVLFLLRIKLIELDLVQEGPVSEPSLEFLCAWYPKYFPLSRVRVAIEMTYSEAITDLPRHRVCTTQPQNSLSTQLLGDSSQAKFFDRALKKF